MKCGCLLQALKAGLAAEIICFKLYTQILLSLLLPLTSFLINVKVAELTNCRSERVKSVNPEIRLRFFSLFMKRTCSRQSESASNFHSNQEEQLMSQPREETCHHSVSLRHMENHRCVYSIQGGIFIILAVVSSLLP